MAKLAEVESSDVPATNVLARAIRRFAQTDGDHNTAIPALTLHRRKAPTEPLHCIYNLGLGVVAQGHKQVLLGGASIDYGPGQSMLTTIDLPVVSHVTRATVREPQFSREYNRLLGAPPQRDIKRMRLMGPSVHAEH